MDAERSLLSKAVFGGDLDFLVSRGIEPEHFADSECREVYRAAVGFLSRYGTPPTQNFVRDQFPDFQIEVSADPIEYLADRFVAQVKRRTAINLYREFGAACDDPDRVEEIEVIAMEMASTLANIVPQPRVGRYSDAENRIEDYFRRLAKGEPPGIFTGFPEIDKVMVGLQPHEFAVVAGWQNSGKSSVMQTMAMNFYRGGATPLYVTLEMSQEECYERWDAMANQIEHRALRALDLTEETHPDVIARWREEAARAKEFRAERDIIVIDDIGSCTPDRVLVETRRYEPDVVFVDYLELMDPSRQSESLWQGIDQIGRQLKRNARVKINGRHIPIVVAAQTNADDGGKGATLDNISYKSTGKHADVVIGIVRTQEMEAQKEMDLVLLKNRNGRRGVIDKMHFEPQYMDLHPTRLADSAVKRHRRGETEPADGIAVTAEPKPGAVASPFRAKVAA